MLLAAGQIVDEAVPVAHDEWDDMPGPWREWLSEHVEAFPHWWLADLRAPAPLEPFVLTALPAPDAWLLVTQEDFDRELLKTPDGAMWVVVHADVTLWAEDRHGYVRVRSALVAPDTATTLLRALQTAVDPHVFFLPYEGGDEVGGSGRSEIDDGEFQLQGLLREVTREQGSIEEHDPLRRITYSFQRPGKAFETVTKSNASPTGLTLTTADGTIVSETTIWGEGVGGARDHASVGRHTEGKRSLVPLDTLLSVLASQERDLIIEVQIDRKLDRSEDRGGITYEPPATRIYLLRNSGVLQTLDRRRRLGRNDRPRTRP
jgi:hypothetical protein